MSLWSESTLLTWCHHAADNLRLLLRHVVIKSYSFSLVLDLKLNSYCRYRYRYIRTGDIDRSFPVTIIYTHYSIIHSGCSVFRSVLTPMLTQSGTSIISIVITILINHANADSSRNLNQGMKEFFHFIIHKL